jgi:hypothetical protein
MRLESKVTLPSVLDLVQISVLLNSQPNHGQRIGAGHFILTVIAIWVYAVMQSKQRDQTLSFLETNSSNSLFVCRYVPAH